MRTFRPIVFVMMCWLSASVGCAQYRFSIVEPAEFAGEIERRGEVFVQRGPIEYGFADLGGDTLGVRIDNLTDEPLMLLGERSYVVDPHGQTHAMTGGTIAPRSYITFALPPTLRVARAGPRVGVGVGVGAGRGGTFFGTGIGSHWGGYPAGYHDTFSTVRSWQWTTGDVRLRAAYDIEGERVEHEFVVRRERVN